MNTLLKWKKQGQSEHLNTDALELLKKYELKTVEILDDTTIYTYAYDDVLELMRKLSYEYQSDIRDIIFDIDTKNPETAQEIYSIELISQESESVLRGIGNMYDNYYISYQGSFVKVIDFIRKSRLEGASPVAHFNDFDGYKPLDHETPTCEYVDENEEYILSHEGIRLWEVEDVADWENGAEESLYKVIKAADED